MKLLQSLSYYITILTKVGLLLLITTSSNRVNNNVAAANTTTTKDYDLRWSSTGGGWLALMSNIGYSELFQKVGLWNETSCSFSAITSYSGGTWFFTQFMFSQQFFNLVHNSNQDGIYQLVIDWMNGYINYQEDFPKINAPLYSAISPLGFNDNLESISILCKIIFGNDGDFAAYVEGMFKRVSTDVYNDPTFVKRPMDSKNRLSAFDNTELHTISALSETAAVFKDHFLSRLFHSDTITYISPNHNISSSIIPKVFAVPIPTLHVVKTGVDKNSSYFIFATESTSLPLHATVVTKANSVTRRFRFEDWEHMFIFPATNGTVYTELKKPNRNSRIEKYVLQEQFGGQIPTISQIHGITSSALAEQSAATPSFFAHQYSTVNYEKTTNKKQLLLTINLINKIKALRGFAICSQWPKPCTKYDGRFIDGGYVDGVGKFSTVLV